MDRSDSGLMGALMAVMDLGIEQSSPKCRSFTLTLIFIPLGFSSDVLATFEGQAI